MDAPWTLVIPSALYADLTAHLFPGDGDEHGAVIAAGIATSERGTRLLARELFIAQDGIDFVPGRWGYRMLTAEFVSERIAYSRDNGLAYLAVHNHGGYDSVGFSEPDNRSHERGYPALLDISGLPVGALVLAREAVAGDIWTEDRHRRALKETIVLGRNIVRLYPEPLQRPPDSDPKFDRQVRWFGERGQALLKSLKVGVIGAGGVGLPLVTMLARIGVGSVVVVDPDRIEPSNLPRLDACRRDAMMQLRKIPVLRRLANRLSTRKVALARRAAKRANPKIEFTGFPTNVIEVEAATELADCDFLFLAADSHQARMVFNAIAHQFLIPGFQIGTRIDTDSETGQVGEIRTNVRFVLPDTGCLRCNNLISATKLQTESLPDGERERNRYVDEVPAPSVITFNTLAASQAMTEFMLMVGGLMEDNAPSGYYRFLPRERAAEAVGPIANRLDCRDCGFISASRRARGDAAELPLPERHRRRGR
jgi:molybdopterin/thiamine biosynthesis adenylyltransferase